MNELSRQNPILADIERINDLSELKDLTSRLGPLQEYARLAGHSLEQINDLAEGRVMAMCKGGYLLRDLERAKTGPKVTSHAANQLSAYRRALIDSGMEKDTAARWQIMSWA